MMMDNNNSRSCNTSLTPDEKYQVILIMGIESVVAAVVCLVAIGMVVLLKLYRYSVHRLAMYQVLAALFFAITSVLQLSFINYDDDNASFKTFCSVSGFFLEYAIVVKLMFTLCLTFHLFCFSTL